MDNKQLVVTSLEDLARYKEGTLVEFPPFGPDQPFVARVKRPSIMALAKTGKIPNTLLDSANKLFFGDNSRNVKYDKDSLSQVLEVIDILCEAAFVEPRYEDLKRFGIELSDDQYMFLFNFTQQGVNALNSFRTEQGNSKDIANI